MPARPDRQWFSPRGRAIAAALRHRLEPVRLRFMNYLLPPADAPAAVSRDDIEYMPHTIAALFQRPPPPAYLIVRGTLLLLVIAVVWAFFADLDEITIGEGKVVPTSQIQVIQNLEGGIVSGIPVKVGDLVQKGQIVLQLDETRFASSSDETKAKHNALMAKIARLTAESSGVAFEPTAELLKSDPLIAADEYRLYQNRQRELEAMLGVLRQQVSQRNQEISEKRARLQQLQESHNLIAQELKMSKPLLAQGVMSEVEILRLERQVNDTKGEMDANRLAIPRLEAQLAEARGKLDGALAKFRAETATELAQAKAEFAGTSATSVAMVDRLSRTSVRTPLSGIVKQIKIGTVGGVIQPGMEIMEIVPIEDKLLIEAKIRPADIGFLHAGQLALVKISAYDFSIYGGLDAAVENITADSITNEKGESFYIVRVRTTKSFLGTPDRRLPIIPGMLATVHVRTGHKSVMSYLLKPLVKAKYDALRER